MELTTLNDFMKITEEDAEITVIDKVWDMETYFYNEQKMNRWDKAMNELSKKLKIVSDFNALNKVVTVDLYGLVEANIDNINNTEGLFNKKLSVDGVMRNMEYILSGGVSEEQLETFVNCLK